MATKAKLSQVSRLPVYHYKEIKTVFLVFVLLFPIQPIVSAIIDVKRNYKETNNNAHSFDNERSESILNMTGDINKQFIISDVKKNIENYSSFKNVGTKSKIVSDETRIMLKPKFNRYQWEAAVNTFPVLPLNGYTKSDPTSYSFHNTSILFSFMIAILPLFFASLFLGLGTLMDFDDLPFLLPFIREL